MKKILTGYVDVKEIGEAGIINVAVATDASIDRDGEIVDPAGLDTKNFEKNPVLLYAHDYRSDPIGKVLEITRDGSRILFRPQLAVDISPRAKMYFEMIKAGILNAFSIGFIPKEWSDRDNGAGGKNRVFTKTELLEISLVPVPANPNALVLARTFKTADGLAVDEDILKSMEMAMEEIAKSKEMSDTLASVKEIKTDLEATKAIVEDLKVEVAANGEKSGAKAATVEELLRHPDFHRSVLTTIDKAVGQTLGRMKGAAK